MSQEPFLIILGTFVFFFEKCRFRACHFSVFGPGSRRQDTFSDTTTDLGSSSEDPPGTRAVLAGVKKRYHIFLVEGLNAILAVGPSLFRIWAPGGKCFAPCFSCQLRDSQKLITRHSEAFRHVLVHS